MDNKLLDAIGKAVWKGMLLGFTIMSTVTAVVLPASYVMNRFIYHAGPMRFVLGLMAAHPVALTIILIGRFINWISNGTGGFARGSYLGLLPLLEYDGGDAAPEGWLASLKRLGMLFIEPIAWVYDDTQYKKAVEPLLLPANTKAVTATLEGQRVTVYSGGVCVPFLAAAREAAANENAADWRDTMEELEESGVGKTMFGIRQHSDARSNLVEPRSPNGGATSLNVAPRDEEEIAPASASFLSSAASLSLAAAAGSSASALPQAVLELEAESPPPAPAAAAAAE